MAFFILQCVFELVPVQAELIEQSGASWSEVNLSLPVNERVFVNSSLQTRYEDNLRTPDPIRLFGDANVYLDKEKRWSAGAGVGWTPDFSPEFRNEMRIYQQINHRREFATGTLEIRNRLTQRLIENTDSVANRIRTRVTYTRPFKSRPKWSLITSNEVFVHLYGVGGGPVGGLEQTRTSMMLARKLNEHFTVRAGYMLQWEREPGRNDAFNHILLTQLHIR